MRIGLAVHGTTFSMGLHPASGRPVLRPQQVMEQALAAGLSGVELPVSLLVGEDVVAVASYADQLGARTMRTVVGGAKIGGDRRPLAGSWQLFLEEALAALREATKVAEHYGINLAVENHQDLASEELLWLCESIGSPHFGITLDTGNPLATAEHPLDFFRSVAPHVKNVHLKDYWIYLSEEGYRLVRCPLGQGIIDFPTLFAILEDANRDVSMSIELGALEARHIRVLAEDYWPDYPPRSASQLARVLRFALANARPSTEDWRTPFEKGETAEAIVAYEEQQLAESLVYLNSISGRGER